MNDKKFGGVGLHAASVHHVERIEVREGQVGSRDGDSKLPATYKFNVSGGNSRAVQTNLGCGIKTGAEDLHAAQVRSGSERSLWDGRTGDSSDHAEYRIGARHNDVGYLGGLERIEGIGTSVRGFAGSEIDDVNLIAAGHDDEGLVGCGINGEAAEKLKLSRGAVCDGQGGRAGARQGSLGVKCILVRLILRIDEAGGGLRIQIASKSVAMLAHGIGNGNLIYLGFEL